VEQVAAPGHLLPRRSLPIVAKSKSLGDCIGQSIGNLGCVAKVQHLLSHCLVDKGHIQALLAKQQRHEFPQRYCSWCTGNYPTEYWPIMQACGGILFMVH
jgi:hypothetical protein